MRSLVIGASGQVGAQIYKQAVLREECFGTYCTHPIAGMHRLDLRDFQDVREAVFDLRPQVCYLPAAFTHVDRAEANPEACRAVNVEGVANLARSLREVRGCLVFFSSEHVFGDNPLPRREDEPVHPVSVYARSKADAEHVIRETLPHSHLILRTSWVFGPDLQQKNFVYRVHRTLTKGQLLVVPFDQFGQPTFAPDLARTARHLVAREARGSFHVVGPAYLSRLDWARCIAGTLGLSQELIEGRPTSDFGDTAPRPHQVRLERKKVIDFLGHDPIQEPASGLRKLAENNAFQGLPLPGPEFDSIKTTT